VKRSKVGTTLLSLTITIIVIAATSAGITSTSRTFWACARDKATPFDRYFAHVDHKSQVPVRTVIIVTVLQMLLGFTYLGNTTAFNAILSMAVLGLYASYLMPIVYFNLRTSKTCGARVQSLQDAKEFGSWLEHTSMRLAVVCNGLLDISYTHARHTTEHELLHCRYGGLGRSWRGILLRLCA
jgi:amino acid transporter